MTFELLLRPGRDDQISHLRGQEVPQPAYTFDFTHLVGDALFELLVQFLYLFCSLAQFFQKSRVLDSDNRLIREGFTRRMPAGVLRDRVPLRRRATLRVGIIQRLRAFT
jgi:hypothetical protein